MARHDFFSFHYQRDIMRVSQVRNSWVTKNNGTTAGFWDAANWESVKRGGDAAIKRWIEEQLDGTSVTVVLIGAETNLPDAADCALVLSHYGYNNQVLGTLGIIGPKRIPYRRIIPLVDQVAKRLSQTISEAL